MEIRLKQRKNCVIWGLLGVFVIFLGISTICLDPLGNAIQHMIKLRNGSWTHQMWENLPVEIYLKVYLFNVSNPERFLSGQDKKLILKEVGPYVYKETRSNLNITFNDNNTISYIPRQHSTFILEKSIGDPTKDRVYVLNLPYLGLLTLMANETGWKQLGVQTFLWGLKAKPFLDLTVDSYMWGYDDKVVRLLTGYFPSWLDFTKFGVLDRVYADKTSFVTMDLDEDPSRKYKIQYWNGELGLKEWGFKDLETGLPCNTLQGAYEGLMFPPNMPEGTQLLVYKKLFCRLLHLKYNKTIQMDNGLRGYRYELPEDEMSCSNPENTCFCPAEGPCMPEGLSDLTPCYYGLPVALSFPHFYGANQSLLDRVEGLKPDKEKHTSHVIIQPDIGMPMRLTTRTQVNLVMNDISYSKEAKSFSNMVLPILWMDGFVDGLPEDIETKLVIAFRYLPVLQKCIAWILVIVGLGMFLYKSVMFYLIQPKLGDDKKIKDPIKYIQVAVADMTMKEDVDSK